MKNAIDLHPSLERCRFPISYPQTTRVARAVLVACTLLAVSARAQTDAGAPDAAEEGSPIEDRERATDGGEPTDEAPGVVPPEVLGRVDAQYPEKALEERREGRVVLVVTVGVDGSVTAAEVAESAGADLDEAALEAVRRWQFSPARQNGEPTSSKIEVPFVFRLPEEAPLEAKRPRPAPSARPAEPLSEPPAPLPEGPAEPIDVTVRAARPPRAEERSISDFRVERDVLVAAPRREGAEVLRAAPGLYIGRGEGAAVAHNYMLRGFDAEHGQDIEFRVGGLPINLPSHIHGQGYADLGFLVADTVRELRVKEGVSDPRQGDFAVAGSIDVDLGIEPSERGVRLQSGYGNFGTFRQLARWAPRQGSEESFGAVQYRRTDGFGQNRAATSGSGIFQHRFGEGDLTYRAIGILYTARSELAGVVRRDDIDAGRVCFYCAYDYPTARAQSGLSSRFLAGFFADYAHPEGGDGQLGIWIGRDDFRLKKNFTGFIQRSQTLENVSGRGDLIDQQNRMDSVGITGRYRTAPFRPTSWAHGTVEVGADGRFDGIDQAQNLIDASVRNQTWDRRVDASVRAVDLGLWGDLDFSLTRYVRARVGMRAAVLSFDVDDRLGNLAAQSRPAGAFLPGFRRSALGVTYGPRTSVRVTPLPWLSVLAAYGEGYRSAQALGLEDGERAPFAKVRSADLGIRFDWGDPLSLQAGGYYTGLSNDVVFEPEEGRLEQVGRSQRVGAVVQALTRPVPWLVGSLSLTYVRATLLGPPAPTAEDPQPPFAPGQAVPYVPPVVARADIGARKTFLDSAAGMPFGGRAGLGFSYLSPRPLPYGQLAEPVPLADASAGLDWGPFDLTLSIFNLLDTRYAAVAYNFPSDWDPGGPRPRTPAQHIAAGAPLSWMISLGVTL